MSDGPVYCPNDGAELKYKVDFSLEPSSFFYCPRCPLRWDGHFPVSDNLEVTEKK
jgi:hypothetical protein